MDSLPGTLRAKVEELIAGSEKNKQIVEELVAHLTPSAAEPDLKRKQPASNGSAVETLNGTNIMLQLPELSVQSPFRKKMNLVFGAFPNEKKAYLALTKSMDDKPDLIIRDLTNENIEFAALLSVPEKPNFRQLLVSYKANDGEVFKNDPILLQLPYAQLTEQFGPILSGKTLVEYLISQLGLVNFQVSDCTQSFNCQAYKGSKEGYLFFTDNHLIFGFKKPILIIRSDNIETITYTSITRLTFNMVLNYRTITGESESVEFSMIDQKDFDQIDLYKRNQQFNDKSMADELKAQRQFKNNTENPGDLAEAAKLVPGGDQIIAEDDYNSEDDLNYMIGDSDDDHSDASQGEEEGDEEEGEEEEAEERDSDDDDDVASDNITPGIPTMESVGNFSAFDEDLQQELADLQRDLDFDINQLQSAGYMNM